MDSNEQSGLNGENAHSQFERFHSTMRGLVAVTKEELGEAPTKEKAEKARAPKKQKTSKG